MSNLLNSFYGEFVFNVTINFQQRIAYNYVDSNWKPRNYMDDWLKENNIGHHHSHSNFVGGEKYNETYRFKNESDAILFKLKWL